MPGPTVVIDAGWGDSSGAWSSWVQPSVARTTRVCTYDRAGMGYSEPGPLPRTAQRFAEELHTLLSGADIPGPYVLVGHSLGGLPVRVFAHEHAAEVAGVVLIESMSPRQAKPSTSATETETDSHSIADWALTLPARTGVLRLLAGPLHADEGLSPEVAHYYSVFWVTPRAAAPRPAASRRWRTRETSWRAIATPECFLARGACHPEARNEPSDLACLNVARWRMSNRRHPSRSLPSSEAKGSG
jgi:pimeloyl-ACP methyl ester carboxylesterase